MKYYHDIELYDGAAWRVIRPVSRAILTEQNDGSVHGGTFTSGAARTRLLNTEVSDPDSIVSLSSNQFTLVAGSFNIDWVVSAHRVGAHISHLYDVTNSAVVCYGTSGNTATDGLRDQSEGFAAIVITTPTVYEIRHEGVATRATDGFGLAWFNPSVFSIVRISGIKA